LATSQLVLALAVVQLVAQAPATQR
jgi:hypothetical protein